MARQCGVMCDVLSFAVRYVRHSVQGQGQGDGRYCGSEDCASRRG